MTLYAGGSTVPLYYGAEIMENITAAFFLCPQKGGYLRI